MHGFSLLCQLDGSLEVVHWLLLTSGTALICYFTCRTNEEELIKVFDDSIHKIVQVSRDNIDCILLDIQQLQNNGQNNLRIIFCHQSKPAASCHPHEISNQSVTITHKTTANKTKSHFISVSLVQVSCVRTAKSKTALSVPPLPTISVAISRLTLILCRHLSTYESSLLCRWQTLQFGCSVLI